MQMPHGAHVTIQAGFELTVLIGAARFDGRFLFLPSTLCAGDAVWLRLERRGARGHAIEVGGRVACVVAARDSRSAWRPLPGGRFVVTVDSVAAARSRDTTRVRFAPDDDDDERAPTVPDRTRSWARTAPDTDDDERDRTTRDHSAVSAVFTGARGP